MDKILNCNLTCSKPEDPLIACLVCKSLLLVPCLIDCVNQHLVILLYRRWVHAEQVVMDRAAEFGHRELSQVSSEWNLTREHDAGMNWGIKWPLQISNVCCSDRASGLYLIFNF